MPTSLLYLAIGMKGYRHQSGSETKGVFVCKRSAAG